MFSELLAQCQQVLGSVNQTLKQSKNSLRESRASFPLPQKTNQIDPTKTSLGATSFPKAQRFKSQNKEQFQLTDVSFVNSEYSTDHQTSVQSKKSFTFTRTQRFSQKNQTNIPCSVLNPNYEVIKKNNKKGPVIKPSINKDLSKSNISQMTAASFSEVGPGKYFTENDSATQIKKSTAFSKEKRFKKEKKAYEDNPLFINQNQTKKRPPSAAMMRKKIAKNAKLISKEQQEQMRQRLKMVYWKSVPAELDRLFSKSNVGPIIKQKYFDIKEMKGREKRCAILMMLDRLNYLRGGFQQNIQRSLGSGPCAAVYRKSTPKPFKFSQMQPGPDYYYPQDDLTKPNVVGFSFNKAGMKEQKPIYDDRDYEVDEQLFKKGGNIIINPIHKQHKLTEDQIAFLNRGPGYYDCLFKQVQKRDDIGIVAFQPLNQNNARQNNCVEINKDINDAAYFPNYTAIDPNIPVPLYKQKTNIQPMHLPDKVLFPQHWLFYDGDLKKVRAEIAKNVLLAKGMDYASYQKYTKRFEAFKEYLKAREPKPELGQYQVKYSQIDPHVEGFDMTKKPQKSLIDPITKEEGEVDGDNLILNPKNFQDHLPSVVFGKMVGRPQTEQFNQDTEPKQGDRLLLQPKKFGKKLPDIKFQKMEGRKNDEKTDEQQPPEGNILILNPKPLQKHIPQIKFQKQVAREQPQLPQLEDYNQIIIEPSKDNKKIKGMVEMARMSSAVRMVPLLRKQKQSRQKTVKESSLSKRG